MRSLKNPAFSFNDDPTLSKFKGLNRRNMQQNDSGTPTNDANLSLSDFAQAGSIFKAAITDL